MTQIEAILGSEFVNRMNELGYQLDGGMDAVKGNYGVLIALATKVKELENQVASLNGEQGR